MEATISSLMILNMVVYLIGNSVNITIYLKHLRKSYLELRSIFSKMAMVIILVPFAITGLAFSEICLVLLK